MTDSLDVGGILRAWAQVETKALLRVRDGIDRILDPDHPGRVWDDEEVDRYYAGKARSAQPPE